MIENENKKTAEVSIQQPISISKKTLIALTLVYIALNILCYKIDDLEIVRIIFLLSSVGVLLACQGFLH